MSQITICILMLILSSSAFSVLTEREFEQKHCGGNCEELLVAEHDSNDPLSLVEHYLLQKYTETYSVLDKDMFIRAVAKIPKSKILAFRGTSKRSSKIQQVGQIVRLNSITSVSADRFIAENFVKDQLLIIKAKSARSIIHYSSVGEKEFILLPGVQLRADKIYTEKVDLSTQQGQKFIDVEVIELTEL